MTWIMERKSFTGRTDLEAFDYKPKLGRDVEDEDIIIYVGERGGFPVHGWLRQSSFESIRVRESSMSGDAEICL